MASRARWRSHRDQSAWTDRQQRATLPSEEDREQDAGTGGGRRRAREQVEGH